MLIPIPGVVWKVTAVATVALALLPLAGESRAAVQVNADLATSVTAAPATVYAGQSSTLTATVTDNGPDQATGLTLSIRLAGAHGTIGSVSSSTPESSCSTSKTALSVRCKLGSLAVGATDQVTVTVAAASAGTMIASVTPRAVQYDPIAANTQSQASIHVAERQAPADTQVYGSAFEQPFTPHRRFAVRWHASDAGSGVAAYDVRFRSAPAGGAFGGYTTWLAGTKQQSASFGGAAGATYCFSIRATDFDGNQSPWSVDRCASVLLPSTSLLRSGAWRASGGNGGLRTRSTGARLMLTDVLVRRIVVAATVGPGYGSVQVVWKGRPLRTLDLASRARGRHLFTLGAFTGLQRGTLSLTVVSSNKTVALDAFGVGKE